MYTANKCVNTYYFAKGFACLNEWPPIWPRAQAAAPFTKSSGIWIKDYFKTWTPFPSIMLVADF